MHFDASAMRASAEPGTRVTRQHHHVFHILTSTGHVLLDSVSSPAGPHLTRAAYRGELSKAGRAQGQARTIRPTSSASITTSRLRKVRRRRRPARVIGAVLVGAGLCLPRGRTRSDAGLLVSASFGDPAIKQRDPLCGPCPVARHRPCFEASLDRAGVGPHVSY